MVWLIVGIVIGLGVALVALRPRLAEAQALRSERDGLALEAARLEERLDAEREMSEDRFRSLSAEALKQNNEQFLDLANAKFKQAGAPLTETLTMVELQMRDIEKERAGAQQALMQTIERVRLSGILEHS